MSQRDLPRRRGRRRALQGPRGREQLVEVRNLAGIVSPCAAHRTAALDQEGRSLGHVLHPAKVVGDPERAHGVAVPVGQELDLVEVERLAPGGLGPGRVARDRERRHARFLELRSPVTQELELVRSGRRPGEQEEQKERRAPCGERSEEHTSELQSRQYLVCRLLLEKKKKQKKNRHKQKKKRKQKKRK